MGNDLLIAVVITIAVFFIFLKLISLFEHLFNIDIPEWMGIVFGILVIALLYFKQQLFFSNPIITGSTIGIILALFWNMKDAKIISNVLKAIFSFKFLLWAGLTALGIYKRSIIMDLWDKYVMTNAASAKPYLLILAIVIYILGSLLILFPGFFVKKSMKSGGFTMNRRIPASKTVFTEITGVILVAISSTLLIEAITFIQSKVM